MTPNYATMVQGDPWKVERGEKNYRFIKCCVCVFINRNLTWLTDEKQRSERATNGSICAENGPLRKQKGSLRRLPKYTATSRLIRLGRLRSGRNRILSFPRVTRCKVNRWRFQGSAWTFYAMSSRIENRASWLQEKMQSRALLRFFSWRISLKTGRCGVQGSGLAFVRSLGKKPPN